MSAAWISTPADTREKRVPRAPTHMPQTLRPTDKHAPPSKQRRTRLQPPCQRLVLLQPPLGSLGCVVVAVVVGVVVGGGGGGDGEAVYWVAVVAEP
jgi:hypothetical protein